MNAQSFLENFGHLANAPDGVKNVKQLVLSTALMGRLSPPNQSLPSDIDETIAAKRASYLQDVGKKEKPLLFGEPLIDEFQIPSGWQWRRVGELCDLQTGATPSRQKPEYFGGDNRWLVSGDINQGEILDCEGRITQEGMDNSNCKIIPPDSVMIALNGQGKTRATVALLRVPAACNQSLVAMIPFGKYLIWPEYLLISLRYRYFEIRDVTGQNQRRGLNMGLISELSVPLPPLEEQKRIVAKVDELMALCDKLKAQQQERERRFPVLSRACHDRFVESPNPANLRAIFDEADTVSAANLRDTILTLAILGKLSPQCKDDESSHLLLGRIEKERCQFAKENKFRMPRLELINDRAAPPLPNGWTWVRLNALFNVITDGDHQPPPKSYSGIAFLTIGNITTGVLDFRDTRFVSKSYYHSLAPYRRPLKGDILYTVVGATYGRPALVDTDHAFCVQRHIAILKPTSGCDIGFLMLLLKSPLVYQQATAGTTGTAQPTIPLTALRNFMVPLPPHCEQRRIVTKVEQLMTLVDQLKEQQHRKNKVAEAFAQAAVSAITGTRISEQKDSMKVPKTELVSRLQTKSKPKATDQAPLADLLDKNQGELAAKALWQQSGLEIDAFYQQLKTEMAQGWIVEPEKARMTEIEAD